MIKTSSANSGGADADLAAPGLHLGSDSVDDAHARLVVLDSCEDAVSPVRGVQVGVVGEVDEELRSAAVGDVEVGDGSCAAGVGNERTGMGLVDGQVSLGVGPPGPVEAELNDEVAPVKFDAIVEPRVDYVGDVGDGPGRGVGEEAEGDGAEVGFQAEVAGGTTCGGHGQVVYSKNKKLKNE